MPQTYVVGTVTGPSPSRSRRDIARYQFSGPVNAPGSVSGRTKSSAGTGPSIARSRRASSASSRSSASGRRNTAM